MRVLLGPGEGHYTSSVHVRFKTLRARGRPALSPYTTVHAHQQLTTDNNQQKYRYGFNARSLCVFVMLLARLFYDVRVT